MMIDHKLFYKVGIGCFLIIGSFNLINFLLTIKLYLNVFGMVSAIAMIVFNFVVAGFFYYLLKNHKDQFAEFNQFDDIDEKEVQDEKKHNRRR